MIRVAVVGAGKMGAHHARVFSRARGASLAGVLDVDARAAEKVARDRDARVLRSLDEAIERADLVVVATPTALHFSQTRRVLAAGRAVLVEKPLAANAADARALCDFARSTDAKLYVGHSERFNAVVRALVDQTARETVTHVATRRMAFAPAEELCVNLAVHDIDLVALLARTRVSLVSAIGDVDAAELAFSVGHATVQRRASSRVRTIVVRTAEATYRGDMLAGSLVRDDLAIAVDALEPLALQAESTLAALRGERSLVATAIDGADAVVVAERAASCLADQRVSAAE